MKQQPPRSPLFPYTTLFRSDRDPLDRDLDAEISARDHDAVGGADDLLEVLDGLRLLDRKSTRLNSSHRTISYAVFCLKKTPSHFGRLTHAYRQAYFFLHIHR